MAIEELRRFFDNSGCIAAFSFPFIGPRAWVLGCSGESGSRAICIHQVMHGTTK